MRKNTKFYNNIKRELKKGLKKQSSNIELLRIVSILLIICMHTYHQSVSNSDNILKFN